MRIRTPTDDHPVPLLADPAPQAAMFWHRGSTFSQAQVLGRIRALVAAFPAVGLAPFPAVGPWPFPAVGLAPNQQWVNLCLSRHAFMLTFCAALQHGYTNVLAADPSASTLQRLRRQHPNLRALSDDAARQDVDLLITEALWQSAQPSVANNEISAALVAALPFTSGSTGEPQAHPKRFGAMRLTADATERRLLSGWPRYSVLATVPSQHMYGLETTLMLALGGRALVACEHPLLPADIARALAALPRPRVLVTTPVHLRALTRSRDALPSADRVLSATAPLATELAAQAELRFGCEVHEIYGCTEAGSLATRRTVEGDVWQLLDGYQMHALDTSNSMLSAQVTGPQLLAPVVLPDRIECRDSERFRLLGRHEDVVNVAGKRASLAHLNQLLLQVEGVLDGLIYVPSDAVDESARLRGLVVTNGRTERDVLRSLARVMDAVFLPRPLRVVSAIPRNATGKVTRAVIEALAQRRASTKAGRADPNEEGPI